MRATAPFIVRALVASLLFATDRGVLAEKSDPTPPDNSPTQTVDGDHSTTEPLDIDLEERIDVQLVLIDAIVMNRKDETIGGLTVGDFELLVGNKPVEIATFDVDCPQGGGPDAPVGATRPVVDLKGFGTTRRYIFVIDYYHLFVSANEVLDRVQDAVMRLHVPGEEYMLMSLGQTLRIEVPFTADPQEISRGIDRMNQDAGLFFGYYGRLTEWRWYERVLTLLDLTGLIPGRKSVVLFSGPFTPAGWNYDEAYKEIAAMAARSRTAFYPVDSRGLVLSSIMGPPSLGRLAVETGGRMTAGTNDLARAFARAQRDEGCRYTLGFYDNSPRLDKQRTVRLFVRQDGLRVVHPARYVVRSGQAKRRSLLEAAWMVPSMFETEALVSNLFLVRPQTDSRWDTLVALEIPPQVLETAPPGTEWSLRATLRKSNGTLKKNLRFTRSLQTPVSEAGDELPAITVFQRLRPRPGSYTLDVVLTNPQSESPLATTRRVVVPPIPENEVFMVGPLLGRDTGGRPVATARGLDGDRDGGDLTLRPLLRAEAVQGEPLACLTTVCYVGREGQPDDRIIRRVLTGEYGRAVEAFAPVPLELDGQGKVRCHTLRDSLATSDLLPGHYNLRVYSQNAVDPSDGSIVEFSVLAAPAAR